MERKSLAIVFGLGVLLALHCSITTLAQKEPQAGTTQASVDITAILDSLPDGQRWIKHLNEDLLPFWTMKEALGSPIGNFPTYRCNDGSLYDPAKPCPELSDPDPNIKSIIKLDRDYVRMKARQVFAYGVAFHMTGEARYLSLRGQVTIFFDSTLYSGSVLNLQEPIRISVGARAFPGRPSYRGQAKTSPTRSPELHSTITSHAIQ